MGASPISSRVAIGFAIAAFALEATAGAMYAAASGDTSGLSVNPANLLASGATGAGLIRWGSLIDMLGYLSLAPVVLYLRARYPGRYVDLFAFAGLAVVVIGSIGAISMATAAPPMINGYVGATAAEKLALLPAFATLYRTVVVGMWQTLETIPWAIWLLGTAVVMRRQGPGVVFVILLVAGALNAAIALYRLVVG
jgi:hypothetical protein